MKWMREPSFTNPICEALVQGGHKVIRPYKMWLCSTHVYNVYIDTVFMLLLGMLLCFFELISLISSLYFLCEDREDHEKSKQRNFL